ncbi:HAD domain-containing protein [Comamonas testosteroni]|uniref:HAD domain-containing protein n=1 Tax=Comamonas testosteroni TaxID=285 RepID=UPI0005B42E1A|nr:HAD domain-containing protein [Comamonas testosteroni]
MSKTILYLDYDGVLHPEPVYRHPRGGMYFGVEHAGHRLFEYSEVLVETLAPYPHVAIVLSTSWVRVLSYSQAKAYLPEALRSRVIGATFHSAMNKFEFDAMTRGAQVLADATRRSATSWVALDDDEEGWIGAASEHLVLTNGNEGLSEPRGVLELGDKLRVQFKGR